MKNKISGIEKIPEFENIKNNLKNRNYFGFLELKTTQAQNNVQIIISEKKFGEKKATQTYVLFFEKYQRFYVEITKKSWNEKISGLKNPRFKTIKKYFAYVPMWDEILFYERRINSKSFEKHFHEFCIFMKEKINCSEIISTPNQKLFYKNNKKLVEFYKIDNYYLIVNYIKDIRKNFLMRKFFLDINTTLY